MKYTPEIVEKLINDYTVLNIPVEELATTLDVPKRSLIAKLSSLGIYKRKQYTDKTGKPPVRKSQYIEDLSLLLKIPVEQLDSLEKTNKRILEILAHKLSDPKLQRAHHTADLALPEPEDMAWM